MAFGWDTAREGRFREVPTERSFRLRRNSVKNGLFAQELL
jgi:hypothetical protein